MLPVAWEAPTAPPTAYIAVYLEGVKRTNIYLRDDQVARLRREAQRTGGTSSDVVRAAVDAWLAEPVAPAHSVTEPAPGDEGPRRPASEFPSTPEGWELRPYFVHDYDLSWGDFLAILRGDDARARDWAIGRLLDRARWQDIWRLVTVETVAESLPHLPLRNREMWDETLRQLGATA